MASSPEPVHFKEAIEYFRQKVNLPTRVWTDLWEGMHARAFVVAGAMRESLIEDLRQAVEKALAGGTTKAEFFKDFQRIKAEHGWTHKGGAAWRARVIFNTNLRMAYAAGKWEQAQRLRESRPFMRYVAVLDKRTRDEHRAWHGTVLPIDDEWWRTHYPPCGWGCRCTVQTLSERDVKRFGYQLADQAPPVEMEDRPVRTPAGDVTVRTPAGIDTGFGYNVGEAAWGRGAQRVALEKHGKWTALDAPGPQPPLDPLVAVKPGVGAGKVVAKGDEAALRRALRDALGGDSAVLTDPTGARILLGQAIADHILEADKRWDGREAFFPLLPELVESPSEIWVGFARSEESGRVAMRRRYVKLLDLGKAQTIALVADADGGMWSGMTFFRGGVSALNKLRTGVRVHRQGERGE